MSVTWAPRARMAENAACPGVSRNVAVPCAHAKRRESATMHHPHTFTDSKQQVNIQCFLQTHGACATRQGGVDQNLHKT